MASGYLEQIIGISKELEYCMAALKKTELIYYICRLILQEFNENMQLLANIFKLENGTTLFIISNYGLYQRFIRLHKKSS